jgi:rod shape-determining protein MreD
MSRQPSQPLQPWLWLGLPMFVCVVLTVLLGAPLRIFGLPLPEPIFAMVLAFSWAVIRPSVMGPFALLAIGLFTDLFYGSPVGLWTLSLLVAYFVALLARNLMAGQSGRVLWGWYVALTGVAFACAYLITMADAQITPSLTATGLQLLVTALLFPAAHRLIDRFEDADVRFR